MYKFSAISSPKQVKGKNNISINISNTTLQVYEVALCAFNMCSSIDNFEVFYN